MPTWVDVVLRLVGVCSFALPGRRLKVDGPIPLLILAPPFTS